MEGGAESAPPPPPPQFYGALKSPVLIGLNSQQISVRKISKRFDIILTIILARISSVRIILMFTPVRIINSR